MNFKRVERVKTGLGVVGFLAFMFVVGTAGASDLGTLSFSACLWRSAAGLAVMYGCVKADAFLDEQVELALERRRIRQLRRSVQEVQDVQKVPHLRVV